MSDETRNEDEIRADIETLAEFEREYGHLAAYGSALVGLSEIGIARHRLAADVPALLAELSSVRAELEARTIERDAAQGYREDNAAAAERIMARAHDAEASLAAARAELAEARRKLADILELGEQLRGPDGNPGSEATAEFFHSVRRLVHTAAVGSGDTEPATEDRLRPATMTIAQWLALPAVGETKDGQR